MSHNSRSSSSTTSRRRRRDGHRRTALVPIDDETTSVASSETLLASEIPDDVFRFPGVDSSSDTEGSSTAVASSVDERRREHHREDDEIIEGSYRHYYLRYHGIDVRRHPQNYEHYQHHRYSQRQQPSSSQGDTSEPHFAWNYGDEEAYNSAEHQHGRAFTFTQDDVDRAVEHLLELALIQVRRERTGRSQPSERERQLRAQAPFLLTYRARRELQDTEGPNNVAVASFMRRVSEQAYQHLIDAQTCIE